jgi:heptosyltransferase III
LPGTIVIYRLGSLGDTIVALPCFTAIAQAFPRHRKILLTNKPVSLKAAPIEAILGGGTGFFDTLISYPVGARSPKVLLSLWQNLRATRSDTLIYLTPPRGKAAILRDLLFFRSAGFGRIIGLPLSSDLAKCRVDAGGQLERESSRLARCLGALQAIDLTQPEYWDLRLTPDEIEAGRAITATLSATPYIAVNMGGKVVKNDWGEDNWTALFELLKIDFSQCGLLIVGAAEDSPRAKAVIARWPGPTVNACGELSPRESGAAMRGAVLFVGHDSGPMHLAAAMNVTCVALFGDNNPPAKWHPFGADHCILHSMAGVRAIRTADVDATVTGVLRLKLSPHRVA